MQRERLVVSRKTFVLGEIIELSSSSSKIPTDADEISEGELQDGFDDGNDSQDEQPMPQNQDEIQMNMVIKCNMNVKLTSSRRQKIMMLVCPKMKISSQRPLEIIITKIINNRLNGYY